jgi:hypothetical protein
MSSLLLVKPLTALAVSNPNANGDPTPALTPDPKEVVVAAGSVGVVLVRLDYGADFQMDSFFCGFWSSHMSLVGLTTGTSAQGGPVTAQANINPALSDYASPRRRHGFLRLGAPITARWVQFALTRDGTGIDANAGIFVSGLAVQPAFGREWGSGRQVVDMSSVTPLRGGGFGIDRGARKPAWLFTCGDLQDAEVPALWNVAEDLGESAPVLACEDPDITNGLNERLHYGLFTNPEAYSREAVGVTKWSFRIVDWV